MSYMHIGGLLCQVLIIHFIIEKDVSVIAAQPSSVYVFNMYITVLIHSNSVQHGHARCMWLIQST